LSERCSKSKLEAERKESNKEQVVKVSQEALARRRGGESAV